MWLLIRLLVLCAWDMLSHGDFRGIVFVAPAVIGWSVIDGLEHWFSVPRFVLMMIVCVGLLASTDELLRGDIIAVVPFIVFVTVSRYRNRLMSWTSELPGWGPY